MKKSLLTLSLCLALTGMLVACGAPKQQKPIGNVAMKLKSDEQTIESYQAALKDNPDSVIMLTGLGRAYYNLADYDKAIKAFKHATEVEDYPMATFYLGLSHIGQGDLQTGFSILTNFQYAGNPEITDAVRSEAKLLENRHDETTESITEAMFAAWNVGLQKDQKANAQKK